MEIKEGVIPPRRITPSELACVAGAWKERKNGRARRRHTRGERECSLSPRVSPSRAPVLSCTHYFQAPAKQATSDSIILQIIRTPNTIIVAVVLNLAKTYL